MCDRSASAAGVNSRPVFREMKTNTELTSSACNKSQFHKTTFTVGTAVASSVDVALRSKYDRKYDTIVWQVKVKPGRV